MLRILVVLPFYGGSLPIGRYCAKALEENNCLVETFESPEFFTAFSALKGLNVPTETHDFLENSFLQVIGESIFAKAKSFQADLVLCLAQAPMPRQILRRLKKANIATAMWFVEDFRLFTYWRAFAPYYDVFAVIQKEPFLQELQNIGVQNQIYLPLAALPSTHKPIELNIIEQNTFGSLLSFLGAGYPNRCVAFERFTNLDFKIWGTEWEYAPKLKALVQQNGRRISPEEAVKIYNATKINLNLHSSVQTENLVGHGDFVNPRTFELAACQAFQLVDRRELMPELFAEDELATFESLDELSEKIEFYKNNPEKREEIAKKSQKRVLQDHTYTKRMGTLLSFIKERLPNFGENNKAIPWPADIPDDLQKNLQDLLDNLKLPKTASFDEAVAALRTKSGQLSDIETALLFLDEWKKLYSK